MPLGAVVMAATGAVLIVALALYLVAVAFLLARVSRSLTAIIGTLQTVEERTSGVGPVLADVNTELASIDETVSKLVPGRTQSRA